MKFVPYFKLDGIPNIIVDGRPHKDSELVLSHWADSGTDSLLIRDTSAQIVLDYLRNNNSLPEGVLAVSNDHFDQDGLVGIFSILRPSFAIEHYTLLVDIAVCGDFGKYENRESARISMALGKITDPDSGLIDKKNFSRPYVEMVSLFYEKGIEMLPLFIENINKYKELWEEEDLFLTESEEGLSKKVVEVSELREHNLAIVEIPGDFHCSSLAGKKAPIHDMALHRATKMGRIIYSHGKKVYFKYRYETWVQLEDDSYPLRIGLDELALKLSDKDHSEWKYQGSDKIIPFLMRVDKGDTGISLKEFQELLINELKVGIVDWDPYPKN